MRKCIATVVAMTMALALSGVPALAQADHTRSRAVKEEDLQAGRDFEAGAKQIAAPFTVLGKTVVSGVTFVTLKGEEGVIYVAEDMVMGAKYVAKDAKFVLIKTAQGARWVSEQGLLAGEIIFDAVSDVSELVIEDTHLVLIKAEDGVVFVSRKALAEGRVVINGVKYAAHKTAQGMVYVSDQTWSLMKTGAEFARDKALHADIRTRLAGAFVHGAVGAHTLSYFSMLSASATASESTRRLAGAALSACQAFNQAWAK